MSSQAKFELEKARAEQARKDWIASGKPLKQASKLVLRQPYVDEARAKVMYAEAELAHANRLLQSTQVRVPYSGMVTSREVDVGQFINIGTELGNTFSVDVAEVRLPLNDNDIKLLNSSISSVDITQEISGSNDNSAVWLSVMVGGRNYQWPATVVRSEGVIHEQNRVHYVVAQVRDPYQRNSSNGDQPPLLMGSFVKAEIVGLAYSNVYPVPRSALHNNNQIAIVDDEQNLRLKTVNILYTDQTLAFSTLTNTSQSVEKSSLSPIRVITNSIESPIEGIKVSY